MKDMTFTCVYENFPLLYCINFCNCKGANSDKAKAEYIISKTSYNNSICQFL